MRHTIVTSWSSNKDDKKVKTRSRRNAEKHAIKKGHCDDLPIMGGNSKE